MTESRFKRILAGLLYIVRRRKLKRPRDPEPQDPYAYVTAPRNPGPPHRSGAAVVELDE